MRNELVVFLTTLVVLFTQISILPATFLEGLGIMLPLIYIVALTAYFPLRTIIINAFIIGIVQDNFSGGMYSFHTIVLLILIYITVRARENMHSEDAYIPALFTGTFLCAYELVFLIWSLALHYSVASWSGFLLGAIISIISGIIVAYPMDELCGRLYRALTVD